MNDKDSFSTINRILMEPKKIVPARFAFYTTIGAILGLFLVNAVWVLFNGDNNVFLLDCYGDKAVAIVSTVFGGLFFGTCIGVMQWLFLRNHVDNVSRWIEFSLIGWVIGIISSVILFEIVWDYFRNVRGPGDYGYPSLPMIFVSQTAALVLCLLLVSTSQWFILRNSFKRSYLWIIVSVFGWTITWLPASIISYFLYWHVDSFSGHAEFALFAPIVAASFITGLLLGKLLIYLSNMNEHANTELNLNMDTG